MPLQNSGAISLLNIATEFGGSAPHSINEYYRGGGLVPNTPANSNIPTSGTISFSQFYGASASSGNVVNPLPFNGSSYSALDDFVADIGLYLNSDGTYQINGSAAYISPIPSNGNWFTPTTTGIGNNYWVRFTRTSFSNNAYGSSSPTTTWLQLSTTRSVGVSAGALNHVGNATATYLVEISPNSGGSPVVGSGTITFTANGSGNPGGGF